MNFQLLKTVYLLYQSEMKQLLEKLLMKLMVRLSIGLLQLKLKNIY